MNRFDRFLSLLQQRLPNFQVKAKENSKLMVFLSWLLFFNKSFLSSFVTTIGQTVYFPQKRLQKKNRFDLITLAHEYIHARDGSKLGNFLFGFLYLFPVSLAPFMLLLTMVSWPLGLFLFAFFLTPLPAPGRMYLERRGYLVSLLIYNETLKEKHLTAPLRKELLLEQAQKYERHFIGPTYYFMWPWGSKKFFQEKIDKIVTGEILQEEAWVEIVEDFSQSK